MPISEQRTSDDVVWRPLWAVLALVVGAVLLIVVRLMVIGRESVNWDEFALLHRAYVTASTGDVVGGGRPGLGTLILAPFAEGCRNAVTALTQARVLWTLIVAMSAVAFWFLLRSALPTSRYNWIAATTGVGLWVLVPTFLRYSIQVRTDQPAILLGLSAGVLLLTSRRNVRWAAAAGLLFALGFLVTQKLLYVAGLCAVLALGIQLADRDWQWRRELQRSALLGLTFIVTLLSYRLLMLDDGRTMLPVAGAANAFEYYRATYGWRLYRAMLPDISVQLLGAGLLLPATLVWLFSRKRGGGSQVLTAWVVLLAGTVVLFFHAARFPYFWMVMGLFPATIAALALPPILDRIRDPVAQRLVIAVLWVPLLIPASRQMRTMLRFDHQAVQREAHAFVDRNFPPDAVGYHPHGLFACREGDRTFPVRFRQNAIVEFAGDSAEHRAAAFIGEFRSRPVQYLVLTEPPFTAAIGEFWSTHYVAYSGAVYAPGRIMSGEVGHTDSLDVIVPGTYIWRAPNHGSWPVVVGDQQLAAGDTMVLTKTGVHSIRLPEGGEGMLVLKLEDPPSAAPRAFYRAW